MGSNQYGQQLKNSSKIATDKMRKLFMRQGYNRRQGAKGFSRNSSTTTTDQLSSSGHGVCEYMGATYSSAQQFTQPAVAQLMRCGSYPLRSYWLTDPSREMSLKYVLTRNEVILAVIRKKHADSFSSIMDIATYLVRYFELKKIIDDSRTWSPVNTASDDSVARGGIVGKSGSGTQLSVPEVSEELTDRLMPRWFGASGG
ncbi:hypothetical protein F511_08010 [Dorcoceras hygrometricum]|uniref:Uncharacterized protein n=1 Tax=Dorcoceras hygrometricum TaxID=472368 RepID=A0A2Z7CHX7_9LAMI|nr:hypothetical protein F511_08010 [Dorcoceras hygrometricum]